MRHVYLGPVMTGRTKVLAGMLIKVLYVRLTGLCCKGVAIWNGALPREGSAMAAPYLMK